MPETGKKNRLCTMSAADMSDEQYNGREFTYASNLVDFLKEHTDFEIWGACYPEKHFESFSKEADLEGFVRDHLPVSMFRTICFATSGLFMV